MIVGLLSLCVLFAFDGFMVPSICEAKIGAKIVHTTFENDPKHTTNEFFVTDWQCELDQKQTCQRKSFWTTPSNKQQGKRATKDIDIKSAEAIEKIGEIYNDSKNLVNQNTALKTKKNATAEVLYPTYLGVTKESVLLVKWVRKMATTEHMVAADSNPIHPEADKFLSKCANDAYMLSEGLTKTASGEVEGTGSISFAKNSICRSIMHVANASGTFRQGMLEGEGFIESLDGSFMRASFREGVLHGLVRRFWCNFGVCDLFDFEEWTVPKYLREISWYTNGHRVGVAWDFRIGGGAVVGHVDLFGDLTGSDIAYIYPDHWTLLIGRFSKGVLVSAKESRLTGFRMEGEIAMVLSEPARGPTFTFEQSNKTHITSTEASLFLRDPFEEQFLAIGNSSVKDAGLGIFLKKNVRKESLVGFYTGLRMSSIDAKRMDRKSMYRLDLDWAERNHVLDVPRDKRKPDEYNATMGHWVNHAQKPNSIYGMFEHPRFGKIGTIVVTKNLKAGEELFCDYGYIDKYVEGEQMFKTIMEVGQVLFNKDKEEFTLEMKKTIKNLKSNLGAYKPYLEMFKSVYNMIKV